MTLENYSRRDFLEFGAAAGSVAVVTAVVGVPSGNAAANKRVRSISAMTWAPDGKLIVADWKNGQLHALRLPAVKAAKSGSFNLLSLDTALASALNLDSRAVRVTAVSFSTDTNRAWLAVQAGRGPNDPVYLAQSGAEGEVTLYNPNDLVDQTLALEKIPGDAALWGRTPARSFLVTDLQSYADEILVAGLANADFSSTLRRVPYPFSDDVQTTSIEMYHAVHNQIETRAPVRAFSVLNLEDKPHLIAAYTCTPLVTVALDELKDGHKVRGKTIAELGYGNTPLSVVPFEINHQGQASAWVLVANAAKSADLIAVQDITNASKTAGLSTPVQVPFQTTAGVPTVQAPINNVLDVIDQDSQFLLALRRQPTDGALQLVSFRKGAFFRLSDFINEYDFPGYDYPKDDPFQQEYIKPFHRLMKTDEGFEDLVGS